MIKFFIWIFIALFSLGQLQRVELGLINFYLHDLFIITWLITHLILSFTQIYQSFTKIKLKKILKRYFLESSLFLVLLLGTLANLVVYKDTLAILYILRIVLYISFAFSLKTLVSKKKITASYLRFQFFSFGALILLLGLLQYTFLPDTRFLAVLGWDDHFNRLISTIFDPGFTGIILVIAYLYFLSLKKTTSLIYYFTTLVFFITIALTFSRASYLSLTLVLILLPLKKKRYNVKKSFFTLVIFLSMVLIIPKPGGEGVNLARTSTITARQISVTEQINKITTKTLVIGNGVFSKQNNTQQYRYNIPNHSRIPDNIFINIFLSTGVLGTLLIILLGYKYLKKLYKIDFEVTIAITTTLLHSQFSNSLLQPFVLLLLLGGVSSIKKKSTT